MPTSTFNTNNPTMTFPTAIPPDAKQLLVSALVNGTDDGRLIHDINARRAASGLPSPFLPSDDGGSNHVGVCEILNVCSSFLAGSASQAYGKFEGFMAIARKQLDEWGGVGSVPPEPAERVRRGKFRPQFVPHLVIPPPRMQTPTRPGGPSMLMSDFTRAYR